MTAQKFSFKNCREPFSARVKTREAKNGEKLFWKEGFHAANRKAKHALTRVGAGEGVGGEGEGYFLFFFIVQSLPVQLAQAKNRDQQFGKRKIHAGNE